MTTFSKIDAVLKVTERCNISCTYCYMFNKDSRLFESKPKQMSVSTARQVGRFLRESAIKVGADTVRVVLHGGEPLMMQPTQFDELCQALVDEIHDPLRVQFSIQTNAMLVDDRWIALFGKYRMGIGISLDGDKDMNDAHRIDHRGRGTYDRTLVGIRRLFAAHESGLIAQPAVLCVINPEQDGAEIFDHLVDAIGFRWLDFMLPIDTRDRISPQTAAIVGKYLEDVFHAWSRRGDRTIAIRFFDNFYSFLTGFDRITGRRAQRTDGTLILTVASDGTYGPDDTLRLVSDDLFAFDSAKDDITRYLADPQIAEMLAANAQPPSECRSCSWAAYCVGGANNGRIVNRFLAMEGYAARSPLCSGLDSIYGVVAKSLIDAGYPRDAMYRRLDAVADRHFDPVAA